SAVLNGVQLVVARVQRERDEIAISRGVVAAIRLRLVAAPSVELPHAGANRQLGTREDAWRVQDTVRHLAGVAGGPEVDEQLMMLASHDALADVVTGVRQSGDDNVRPLTRLEPTGGQLVAQHAIVSAEEQPAVVPVETTAAQSCAEARL